MVRYVVRRLLYMVPTIFLISLVAFLIISLPPGDYLLVALDMWRMRRGTIPSIWSRCARMASVWRSAKERLRRSHSS